MRVSYRWLMVVMLWMVCFLNYADRQVIFTVFPLLRREFALDNMMLAVLSASFMVMYALFGPFAGWLCDRWPRRKLVIGALIFWSLTTLFSSFAHTYWQLLCGTALSGLGEAFYFPAAMSLISDYHSNTRSRAMSLHQSSVYIGSICGGSLAGYFGQFYGWRTGFRAFGLAGIFLGLVVWKLLREGERGMSDPMLDARALAASQASIPRRFSPALFQGIPLAWLLVAVFVGANFVAMVFTVWLPTYLYTTYHMALGMAGLNATAYMQVSSVLGVVIGGVMADHLRRTHKAGRMLVQGAGLLCGVPFLFLTGWTTASTIVLLAMAGFGCCKGLYDSNNFAAMHDLVPVERRGIAIGAMNSLGWLGASAAQLVIGVASLHYGLAVCLSATAGIYLICGLAMLRGAALRSKTIERA